MTIGHSVTLTQQTSWLHCFTSAVATYFTPVTRNYYTTPAHVVHICAGRRVHQFVHCPGHRSAQVVADPVDVVVHPRIHCRFRAAIRRAERGDPCQVPVAARWRCRYQSEVSHTSESTKSFTVRLHEGIITIVLYSQI